MPDPLSQLQPGPCLSSQAIAASCISLLSSLNDSTSGAWAGTALAYLVRSSLGVASFKDRDEMVANWMPHQIDGISLLLPLLLKSMPQSNGLGSGPGIRDAVDSITMAAGSWLKHNPCPDFSAHGDAADASGLKLLSLSLALPLLVGLDEIHYTTKGIERRVLGVDGDKKSTVLNHLWSLLLSSDDYERKTGLAHWFQGLLAPAPRSKL